MKNKKQKNNKKQQNAIAESLDTKIAKTNKLNLIIFSSFLDTAKVQKTF